MRFKEFGNRNQPSVVLIHGLFVSWEIFLPIVNELKNDFHLIVPMLDGHIYDNGMSEPSLFTTIDDEAHGICDYLQKNDLSQIYCVYGISLGGGIAARLTELNRCKVKHLIIDAGPILPYGTMFTLFCSYYQALNCWCTCHFATLYKKLFHSHYFQVAIDEVQKTYPSGGMRTPINVYKSLYAYQLTTIPAETSVEFWHGSKETWIFQRCVNHILKVRPDTSIIVFPKMQHAQVVIDKPEIIVEKIRNK